VEFIEVETFLLAVHYFRSKDDPFSITLELKVIAAATFVQSIADFYRVNAVIYLIQCSRDIVVLVTSNFMPVLHSYRDEHTIFPTPEMIENFSLTLEHEKALTSFRAFLRTNSAVLTENPSISATFADKYLLFLFDITDFETRKSTSKAGKIRTRYILSGLFTQELRQRALDDLENAETVEQVREAMEPLVQFARDQLEHEYFPRYKDTERFADIQKETEQFLRWVQREGSQNEYNS
jgi:hypothetical protein